jgi:hypothetical protein
MPDRSAPWLFLDCFRPNWSTLVKGAIYARVSTADQNCELQLAELREYVRRHGWEIAEEYVDTGWSGAKATRPELDRLMQDAAQRKFEQSSIGSWIGSGVPAPLQDRH